MRHWKRDSPFGKAPVSIVEHPDVRRLLLTSAGYVQAMRSLVFRTAMAHDLAHSGDEDQRRRYSARLALLTPACKAWATDWGFRVTEWSLQIFGGYGYTTDYMAEQYLRDSKITSIYEGANGIQALDFVTRKLPMEDGAVVAEILAEVGESVEEAFSIPKLSGAAQQVLLARDAMAGLLRDLSEREDGLQLTVLNAVPILDMFGAMLGGSYLLEQSVIAYRELGEFLEERGIARDDTVAVGSLLAERGRATYLHNKIQTTIHFCYRALPPSVAQVVAIEAGETAALEVVL